jgi:hypothetical protein
MPLDEDRPAPWRALAAEALDVAKQLTDPAAKQIMLAIAEKYVELAERVDERGGTCEPKST